MNFLLKPKNLDFLLELFNSEGDVIAEFRGSEVLTQLSRLEKSVAVSFITTISSGDITVVTPQATPDVVFKEARLSVIRERTLIEPGLEYETMKKTMFDGEVSLPFTRNISNQVTFPLRSFLVSKNVENDINLGAGSAKAHVQTLLSHFDRVTVDTASFAAIDDDTSMTLNIDKEWFETYNDIITGLCWLGRFALYFEGHTVYAVPLMGLPEDPIEIKNEDILLDDFEVSTPNENEIITRFMVSDPNNNRVSWYNNVDTFGDNQQQVRIPYLGTLSADVTNAANFWLTNRSNLWLRFNLKLPYKFLDLQPYDVVELEDVGKLYPSINVQQTERFYFDPEIPSFYTFTTNLREVFKGGGFVFFKTIVEPVPTGESVCIFDLGGGSGLFVADDGKWTLTLHHTAVDAGTWTTDDPVAFDTYLEVELSHNEGDLNAEPQLKVNDVILDMTGTQPTEASIYEAGLSVLGRAVDTDYFKGFIFDVLFYNQQEQIAVFAAVAGEDTQGRFRGVTELTEVPGQLESGIANALARVQRVGVGLDGTMIAFVESDIDALSGNRNASYWLGPGNDSGIQIIGQTVNETGMATLSWRPLTVGFTKYEIYVEKNGAEFYTNDNVTDTEHNVQLTDEESNTYTWRVRGFTDAWQPWSFTAQFRWIPDEFTDGRITAMEWVNNEYNDPYGPEYDILLPNSVKFVVNAIFDRLQVRANNLIEFSGPTSLPQGIKTNIQADSTDKRFYVRGLNFDTNMYSDWYMGPEYADHPGAPNNPTGNSDEANVPSFYVNDTGPVLWQWSFTVPQATVVLNIPDRASSVTLKISEYSPQHRRYVPKIQRTVALTEYPHGKFYNLEDVVHVSMVATPSFVVLPGETTFL